MNRPQASQPLNEPRYVSTAQVSQALGVSVTTVKRWVDDGILPAHRTAGGHRKLLMTDVLRLVREGNLPQADLGRLLPKAVITTGDPQRVANQLSDAVNAADTDLIRTIIHGAYQAGLSVETIADRIIAPVMANVGHEWQTGRFEVMIEHRITQAFVSALYELKAFLRSNMEQDRPVAVGGAPEHDHYLMPTLLAKLTLLDAGWEAINLGPHTPMSALRVAIEDLSPSLIWVSATHIVDATQFVREFRDLYALAEEHGVAVAIGGRGLTDAIRTQIPYTTFGDGFTQLAAFAKSLYRRPKPARRGRPTGNSRPADPPPATDVPPVRDADEPSP